MDILRKIIIPNIYVTGDELQIELLIPFTWHNSCGQILTAVSLLYKHDVSAIKFHLGKLTEEEVRVNPSLLWMENALKGFGVDPYSSSIHPALRCYELPLDTLSLAFYSRFADCIDYADAYDGKGECRLIQFERFTLLLKLDDDTDLSPLDEHEVRYLKDEDMLG